MQYAEKYKYNGGIDYIDAIFSGVTGRNMAPLRTADFVGLDVHKAIVDNVYVNTSDSWHEDFRMPYFCERLIHEGKLGRKNGYGLYHTEIKDNGRKIQYVFDIEMQRYREVNQYYFPFQNAMMDEIRQGNYFTAYKILLDNQSVEAMICKKLLTNYILYSIVISQKVSDGISAADDAMATGFKWCPPMALAELMGLEYIKDECQGGSEPDKRVIFNVLAMHKKSKYDYRKYIKAVR